MAKTCTLRSKRRTVGTLGRWKKKKVGICREWPYVSSTEAGCWESLTQWKPVVAIWFKGIQAAWIHHGTHFKMSCLTLLTVKIFILSLDPRWLHTLLFVRKFALSLISFVWMIKCKEITCGFQFHVTKWLSSRTPRFNGDILILRRPFCSYSPESDGLISIKLSPPDFPVIRCILASSQVVLIHPRISPGRRFLSGHRGSVRSRGVAQLMDQPAWQPRVIPPLSFPHRRRTAASLQHVAEGGLGGEWLHIADQ